MKIVFQGDSITDASRDKRNYHDMGKGYPKFATELMQVTVSMESEPTRSRELKGLQTAMDAFGLNSGIILTLTESETISLPDGKEIIIMPCWRWML